MSEARIEALRDLIARNPQDALSRYMLGIELYRQGRYEEAATEIEAYLAMKQDEGAAYRVLADAYLHLGRPKEARWALRQGAEAARAHHHEGMAEEFEERIAELDG